MKLTSCLVAISFLAGSAVNAVSISPVPQHVNPFHENRDVSESETRELVKRKGGGGRGGGGGGGGSSSGGGGGGRSGSKGGGGSSGTTSRTSSSSNRGGATRQGSGPPPAYGKGAFYGGGAKVPYTAGRTSPLGIVPFVAVGGLGAVAVWGAWHYPPYIYPYHNPYTYRNRTTNQTETRRVLCGCEPYEICGCDDNNNTTFLDDVLGDHSYASLNRTLVNLAVFNGSDSILLNGTLPNGTTAAGGEDDDDESAAAPTLALALRNAAWWPVVGIVLATVFLV